MSYSRVAHSKAKTSSARATGRQQHIDGRPYQARRPPPTDRRDFPPAEMDQSHEAVSTTTTASTSATTTGERSLEKYIAR